MLRASTQEHGFSLIEVLIALLVLAIGLLGMASLMLTSMKSNQSAAQRSQASYLAYDMTERMRLNSTLATTTGANDYVTNGAAIPADPGCKANGCTPTQMAQLGVREWLINLGQAGVSGTVTRDNNNQYTIVVSWQEDSSLACANNVCSFTLTVIL